MQKNVLVTGAASGIGQALTAQLAAKGYHVFATYRQDSQRQALASLPNVRPLKLDITDPKAITAAAKAVDAEVGAHGLYALVNSAGLNYAAPFEYVDAARAQALIDVNLMAPFHLSQAFLPLLRRHNKGQATKARIVNISSWAASFGQPFISFYNASKFAIAGLSESMFYDLGLLGVHVVLASPGVTKTPMLGKTTQAGIESLAAMPPEDQVRYRPLLEHFAGLGAQYGNSPLLRTPEQVASNLLRILETPKPRFAYDLAPDAWFVNRFFARFAPWWAKVAMNRRTYRLGGAA